MADASHVQPGAMDTGLAIEGDINTLFVVWAASLVVLMQVAFALLEVAHVAPKNSRTVILKNALDNAFGAAAWFLTGFALAGGALGTGIGRTAGDAWAASVDAWTGSEPPASQQAVGTAHADAAWVFYFSFASSAATIVSGATAERTCLVAHLTFSVAMCGFIYPLAHYWLWGSRGWLNSTNDGGVLAVNAIDVAGSGVVHVLGGVAALVGAYIAGPRIKTPTAPDPSDVRVAPLHSERSHGLGGGAGVLSVASDLSLATGTRDGGLPDTVAAVTASGGLSETVAAAAGRPASRTFIVLGAFVMWYSFYGFNLGALGAIIGRASSAGRIMMLTTIGGMSGAVTAAALGMYVSRWELSISNVCNGLIAGLVSTAACCAVVPPWTGFVIGGVAAAAFMATAHSVPKLGIDDPVNAGPTHFCGGSVGLLAVGLFARREPVEDFFQRGAEDVGILYGGHGGLFGAQVLALLMLTTWSAVTSAVVFYALRRAGLLRQPLEVEVLGIDASVFESKQHKSGMALSVLQQARAAEERCHPPQLLRRRSNAGSSSNRSNHSGSFHNGAEAVAVRTVTPPAPVLLAGRAQPAPPADVALQLPFLPPAAAAQRGGDPYAAAAARDVAATLPGTGAGAGEGSAGAEPPAAGLVACALAAAASGAPEPASYERTMRRTCSLATLGQHSPAPVPSGGENGDGAGEGFNETAQGHVLASAPCPSCTRYVPNGLQQLAPTSRAAGQLADVHSTAAVPVGPPSITTRRIGSVSSLQASIVRAGSNPGFSATSRASSGGWPFVCHTARSMSALPEADRRSPRAGVLASLFDRASGFPSPHRGSRRVVSAGEVSVISLDRGDRSNRSRAGVGFSCGGPASDAPGDGDLLPMLVSRVYVPSASTPPRRLPDIVAAVTSGSTDSIDGSRQRSSSGGPLRQIDSAECDGIETNASELSFRRYAHGSSRASSAALSLGDVASNHGSRRRGLPASNFRSGSATHAPQFPGSHPTLAPSDESSPLQGSPGPLELPCWAALTAAVDTSPFPLPAGAAGSNSGSNPGSNPASNPASSPGSMADSDPLHGSGTLSTHATAVPLPTSAGSNAATATGTAVPPATAPPPTNGQSDVIASCELTRELKMSAMTTDADVALPLPNGTVAARHLPQPRSEPLLQQSAYEAGALASSVSTSASGWLPARGSLSLVEVWPQVVSDGATVSDGVMSTGASSSRMGANESDRLRAQLPAGTLAAVVRAGGSSDSAPDSAPATCSTTSNRL
eukprot:jgi/Ulvmu1/4023/UM189_0007.1